MDQKNRTSVETEVPFTPYEKYTHHKSSACPENTKVFFVNGLKRCCYMLFKQLARTLCLLAV
jgi:hypothetical protein